MFITKPSRRRVISSTESSKTPNDSKMPQASAPMKIETLRSFSCNIDEYNEKTAARYYDGKTWEMYHRIVTSRRRGSFNQQGGRNNDYSENQGILKKRQEYATDFIADCSEINQHDIPSEAMFQLDL